MALFSETHLKPYERFYIPNYHFYRIVRHLGRKGGTALAVRKGIPHSHIDLPPLISVDATAVCIPIGNKFCLQLFINLRDVPEVMQTSLRHKCILACDLNAKHLSWNSAVSNPSGEKLL
jgi:hypothetical protein